jgi:large subunit ribosomal protein L28
MTQSVFCFQKYCYIPIHFSTPIAHIMSKVCVLTGKRPKYGNTVSHANNHRRTRFEPNLHTKRVWIEEEKRWVKVRLSAKALKIMSRKGTAELAKLLK